MSRLVVVCLMLLSSCGSTELDNSRKTPAVHVRENGPPVSFNLGDRISVEGRMGVNDNGQQYLVGKLPNCFVLYGVTERGWGSLRLKAAIHAYRHQPVRVTGIATGRNKSPNPNGVDYRCAWQMLADGIEEQ